jgi:hypothetical protein
MDFNNLIENKINKIVLDLYYVDYHLAYLFFGKINPTI